MVRWGCTKYNMNCAACAASVQCAVCSVQWLDGERPLQGRQLEMVSSARRAVYLRFHLITVMGIVIIVVIIIVKIGIIVVIIITSHQGWQGVKRWARRWWC